MSLIIVTPQLDAKLSAANGPIELCSADGRLLGYFTPTIPRQYKLDPGISDEEAERRLAEPGGRKLADIIRDLENRA